MKPAHFAATALLALAACSKPAPEPSATPSEAPAPATEPSASAEPAPAPEPSPTLTAATFDGLEFGQPVPKTSGWKLDGEQASDECLTYASAKHANVYAMIEGGKLQRFTVMEGSDFKLPTGLGIGSTEAAVRKAYPGFIEEPHTYSAPPAKTLTSPDAKDGKPGLRFEIDEQRKVQMIHMGLRPALEYVEGCA